MKKIPTLYKRDFDGDPSRVLPEVTPGCEWVIAGEGQAYVKWDGTACLIRDGVLYRRFDRKLKKSVAKARNRGKRSPPWMLDDFKPAPEGFEPCDSKPDFQTGHWPGWVPVGDGPQDAIHREAARGGGQITIAQRYPGTYELIGPGVQGNPHKWEEPALRNHSCGLWAARPPVEFDALRDRLETCAYEGFVWHHPDGRMAKIKRRDFGLEWPVG